MIKTAVLTTELTTRVVKTNTETRGLRAVGRVPISWMLFLGSLAVYWLTRTHLNTFDAVAYADQIGLAAETGKLRPLFHPHHLLFNGLCFGVWRLARGLGYGGGPLVVAQSVNAVLGAWGVSLFYVVLARIRPASILPLLLAIGLAGSFGWWICATDGRVNMPSSLLMLAAYDRLICLRTRPGSCRAAIVGLLAGSAVLFHESAGIFGVVCAVGVLGVTSGRQRIVLTAAYGASWASVIIAAYGLVGVAALHLYSPSEFQHWMNAYAERGWWWDFHVIHNLRLDLFGLRHAVFVQPLGRTALAQTPLHLFGTAALGLLWLCYGLALLGLTAAAGTILFALPSLRKSADWPIALTCFTWIGLYGAFFTVWCPGAFVFWVPVLVPLGTLLLLSRPSPLPLGLWVSVLVTLNFLAGILPYLKPVAGLSQREAFDIRSHTPRSLMIVSGVGDDAQCEVDIPYFANRPVLSLHGLLAHSGTLPAAQLSLEASLTGAFGAHRQVYVMDEIWSRRDQVKGLQRQSLGLDAGDLRALFLSYNLVSAWNGPRGTVWRVLPLSAQSRSSGGQRRTNADAARNAD
ncbi:MAG: hypothetical protein ACRYFS_04415 [Janthinobacterium lividum]